MDLESRKAHTRLIDTQRVAALGTLRDGAPFVSLVPFVVVLDAAVAFYTHISRLALHTRDILADPRVGLMISETDGGAGGPQRLARVCIEGMAAATPQDPGYAPTKARYLARFRDAAFAFHLADFSLFRIVPSRGRYIAGFGRIFDIVTDEQDIK